MGLLSWKLEQLDAITPGRIGRNGLKPGVKAPDFDLTTTDGKELSLRGLAGRTVLLVFTQPGCAPCHLIVPDLNRVQQTGRAHVVGICAGTPDEARGWTESAKALFPVVVQDHWKVSRQYEAFATPFAFVIDGNGVVTARGVITKSEHIRFLFSIAKETAKTFELSHVPEQHSMALTER
jgi:peroxiredoxin